MYTNEVALRYAMALASFAAQNDLLDTFENELDEIETYLDKTPDLENYLAHPKIRPADKQDLITKAFAGFSKEMINFLNLLIEKKRWRHLKEIKSLYKREANLYRGRVGVVVESAYPLKEDIKEQIQAKLEQMTKRPVDLSMQTTPELIGGIKVRIGHKVIDASVANQLREMKRDLLEIKGKSRGESQ